MGRRSDDRTKTSWLSLLVSGMSSLSRRCRKSRTVNLAENLDKRDVDEQDVVSE